MKKKIDIEIIDKKQIPQSEPERQYYFMDIAKNYVEQLSAKKGSPLTFHVTTFGCQMNARDSEKLVGILERIGYVETDTEDADFVIYNTCTVRENANNKVLQVIPKFYSFCPVFTVDLEKLTGISAKKLGDYKGIRVKVRVVSDASRHVGIGINSFFGKAGTINKKYAFNTYTTQSNALPNEKEYYKFYYTEGMVTPETPDDGSMPQVENGKSAKGHKFKETDKDVGFATKTLLFNKKLTADLRSQTTFDFVVGGSYGPANKEYLAWYLDDVELIC